MIRLAIYGRGRFDPSALIWLDRDELRRYRDKLLNILHGQPEAIEKLALSGEEVGEVRQEYRRLFRQYEAVEICLSKMNQPAC